MINLIIYFISVIISFFIFSFIWSNLILPFTFIIPFTNYLIELGPVSKNKGKIIKKRYLSSFIFNFIIALGIIYLVKNYIPAKYHISIIIASILPLIMLIFTKGWSMDPGNVEEYFKSNYKKFKEPEFAFYALKQDIDPNIQNNKDMKKFLKRLYNSKNYYDYKTSSRRGREILSN